jgi:hypothetical protein
MTKQWTWFVRGFYNSAAKPPRKPGQMAIEVGGISKEALDMDILVLLDRKDIGKVELQDPAGNITYLRRE